MAQLRIIHSYLFTAISISEISKIYWYSFDTYLLTSTDICVKWAFLNLVISKPVKCNCYSHVGCVLMIQTVQKLPHVFLSVYLSKDGDFLTMYWYESPLINTESLNMIFFFIYFFGNFPCFTFSINYHILLFP